MQQQQQQREGEGEREGGQEAAEGEEKESACEQQPTQQCEEGTPGTVAEGLALALEKQRLQKEGERQRRRSQEVQQALSVEHEVGSGREEA